MQNYFALFILFNNIRFHQNISFNRRSKEKKDSFLVFLINPIDFILLYIN